MEGFSIYDIFFMAISFYFIYVGIRQFVTTDSNYILKKTDRYTKESMDKMRIPMGICMVLFGVCWFTAFLVKGLGYPTAHLILRWGSLAFLAGEAVMFFMLKVKKGK